MYKVIIPEKYPQCEIIDEKEKKCLIILPIAEQQKAQNIADTLNAVEIYDKSIAELMNERYKAMNLLESALVALKSIERIYDWQEDAAGKIAHEAIQTIDFFNK